MKSLIAASIAVAMVVGSAATAFAGAIESSVDTTTLPKSKTTPLGLYLTPKDAWAALQADPAIVFIDVRDPIEISYVGHADPVDAIVPLNIATHRFDPKKGGYASRPNPNFVAEVDAAVARAGGSRDTAVFVICRSGGRSAKAATMMVDAGYTNVWNLVEGFEGDKDDAGVRAVNGWRNAGLPWTYKIAPEVGWSAED